MPLISHRGAAHLAEANTKKAIVTGDNFSPAYIEVDINCTADDMLVIYHGSVSRFLNGKKTKETYAELLEKHPDVPTLKDFMSIPHKSPFIYDIKINDPEGLKTIIRALKKQPRRDFAFTSPHETALAMMKQAFPKSETLISQPYHLGPIAPLELARKNGFSGIMLNKWWLTPLVYNLCKLHKKSIGVYTIDSALAIWLAQKMFPGAYIVTNRPNVYRRIFPRH